MSAWAQKNSGPVQTALSEPPEPLIQPDTMGKKEIPIPPSIHALPVCRSNRAPMVVLLSLSVTQINLFYRETPGLVNR